MGLQPLLTVFYAGPGSGEVKTRGVREDDYQVMEGIKVAQSFIHCRPNEFKQWLCLDVSVIDLRNSEYTKNVIFEFLQLGLTRTGASCGVASLLALLRLYFGVRLWPNIAATGALTLNGEVWSVADVPVKVSSYSTRKCQPSHSTL